ncbi:hypothetical protein J1605_021132 [Eschrichtius robustus]|uniref:Proline-rich protein 23C n=1 Tax=Eschrichtius robustus TaxID=9764 RepID=A0AB34HGF3_ESCRO|nr:hypothetical protein J1605_021132 [Eschrichtius robustus]
MLCDSGSAGATHNVLGPLLRKPVHSCAPPPCVGLTCQTDLSLPAVPSPSSPSARPQARGDIEKMGSRPRSPSASPADRWGPQPGGPGPAKRRRTEEPAGPESKSKAAPSLDNLTWPPTADTLIFVVVLPTGCALHVPLDDVDLLLEPEPTSVRQVSLGDRILMLVPEALLGSGVEGPWGQGLGRGAFLSAPGEYMALEPGVVRAAAPEFACQEEVNEEEADADADFLPAGTDAAAVSVAGLRPSAGFQVLTSVPNALMVLHARPGDACSLNQLPPTIPGQLNGQQERVF